MEQLETTVKKISSGVWAFDQGMVRCFLIVGSVRAMLLDTGAVPCDLMGLIRSITPLPLVVLHTHGDGDHTANDNQFPNIYAHPKEFPIIRQFRPELTSTLHPITAASSFDLGGRILQVIETPGHTPGSLCLLDRASRILFSGDTLSYGPVFLFGQHRDIHTYRKTLDYLMQLGGFDTVYPCHNSCPISLSVISGLMAAVDGALDGSIAPADNPMPIDDGAAPKLYQFGKCGILYC
jgi:glyoxylase-like metal-dependent hydrolase (beta-lactamase superfamily II)